jgi:P-type Mg2+ transporter
MVVVLLATLCLPYLPLSCWLGFAPLPLSYLLSFGVITALYLLVSELTKKFIYRRV